MKECSVSNICPRERLDGLDMKGQDRKRLCVEPGRDCFIYGCLERKKEMKNDDGAEGVGLVRCRHLTHVIFCFWKTEIKYANAMAETSLWIYLHQSLILPEQPVLCQKLIITLYDRKVHFIVSYLEVALIEYLGSIICTLALIKSGNYFSV